MDCIVHGVTKSWTRLGDVHFTQTHTHTHIYIYMYINNYYPRKMFAFYKNGKILIVKVVIENRCLCRLFKIKGEIFYRDIFSKVYSVLQFRLNKYFICYGVTCLSVCLVTKSCLTVCDPMDCSPPGSPVHGIFQARLLEWVAISSSRRFPDQGLNLCLLNLL